MSRNKPARIFTDKSGQSHPNQMGSTLQENGHRTQMRDTANGRVRLRTKGGMWEVTGEGGEEELIGFHLSTQYAYHGATLTKNESGGFTIGYAVQPSQTQLKAKLVGSEIKSLKHATYEIGTTCYRFGSSGYQVFSNFVEAKGFLWTEAHLLTYRSGGALTTLNHTFAGTTWVYEAGTAQPGTPLRSRLASFEGTSSKAMAFKSPYISSTSSRRVHKDGKQLASISPTTAVIGASNGVDGDGAKRLYVLSEPVLGTLRIAEKLNGEWSNTDVVMESGTLVPSWTGVQSACVFSESGNKAVFLCNDPGSPFAEVNLLTKSVADVTTPNLIPGGEGLLANTLVIDRVVAGVDVSLDLTTNNRYAHLIGAGYNAEAVKFAGVVTTITESGVSTSTTAGGGSVTSSSSRALGASLYLDDRLLRTWTTTITESSSPGASTKVIETGVRTLLDVSYDPDTELFLVLERKLSSFSYAHGGSTTGTWDYHLSLIDPAGEVTVFEFFEMLEAETVVVPPRSSGDYEDGYQTISFFEANLALSPGAMAALASSETEGTFSHSVPTGFDFPGNYAPGFFTGLDSRLDTHAKAPTFSWGCNADGNKVVVSILALTGGTLASNTSARTYLSVNKVLEKSEGGVWSASDLVLPEITGTTGDNVRYLTKITFYTEELE